MGEKQMGLVSNVTAENYRQLASDFIAMQGKGFAISAYGAPDKSDGDSNAVEATPREWGAWMKYLHRIGYTKTAHALRRARYWTVPARWPHEFDAGATLAEDQDAAFEFQEFLRRKADAKHGARRKREQARAPRWWDEKDDGLDGFA
jgi:hypothetical protein